MTDYDPADIFPEDHNLDFWRGILLAFTASFLFAALMVLCYAVATS